MSTAVKIVIIGGGSYSWGPLFVRDLAITPELAGSTIVLHDLDAEALDLVYRAGQLLIQTGNLPITLEKTTQLEAALPGAQFVILTITTGGLAAMRHDLEIPARYGIVQSVGDTVGPGGLARGLRNIPVVVEIARQMERHCPQAWLLNYTNPMTTLTRAVSKETGIRTVGLCHEWLGVRHKLARLFQIDEDDFQPRIAGINHLIWLLDLWAHGRNLMPTLHETAAQILAGQLNLDPEDHSSLADRGLVKATLLQTFGALPVAGDRHVAEFFPYFLTEATEKGRQFGVTLTTVEERAEWRAKAKQRLLDLLAGRLAIRPFLQQPSSEAAHRIIRQVARHGRYTGIMNLPNVGQIANLPYDAVVETYGIVDSTGAHGISAGHLPPGIQAIVSRHVANQEMIVTAALTGDRTLALQALLNDPLTHLAPQQAGKMLNEMLVANKAYLPLFL
jgi:alpha-galactosidase